MDFERLAKTAALVRFLKEGLVEEAGHAGGLGLLPVPRDRIELLQILHADKDRLDAYYEGLDRLARSLPRKLRRRVVISTDTEVMLDTYLKLFGRTILRYVRLEQRKQQNLPS
jgi:hypothetical protein